MLLNLEGKKSRMSCSKGETGSPLTMVKANILCRERVFQHISQDIIKFQTGLGKTSQEETQVGPEERSIHRCGWGCRHVTHRVGLVPGDGNGFHSNPSFPVNRSLSFQVQVGTGVGADGDTPRSVPVRQRRGLIIVGLVVAVAVVAIVWAGLLTRGSAWRAGWRASSSARGWAGRDGGHCARSVYMCLLWRAEDMVDGCFCAGESQCSSSCLRLPPLFQRSCQCLFVMGLACRLHHHSKGIHSSSFPPLCSKWDKTHTKKIRNYSKHWFYF